MSPDVNPYVKLGQPTRRIDGPDKVTGAARYETDTVLPGMAYAALVTAATTGALTTIDAATARAQPGVLEVVGFGQDGEPVRPVGHVMAGGYANSTWLPFASARVAYPGQAVAMVVAETAEAAEGAAALVVVRMAAEPGTYAMAAQGTPLREIRDGFSDSATGDAALGFAAAAATVEAVYETPIQHHNPLEPYGTICVWDGDDLKVHEPARFVTGLRHGLAAQLGLAPERVRVLSRLVGGHFGSRMGLSQHTAPVALAARRLGRPVKLLPSRRDGFTIVNHRPETRHRVRLGATADGRLTALALEADVATSRFDDFAMPGNAVSAGLYACPNIATVERIGRVDRNTPSPMRAPPEVPYIFALESAMDELSQALGLDPIELRRRNDTAVDPVNGDRYTTRPLMRCFDAAASAFGWRPGPARPRCRREGDWWIGAGCASAVRPVKTAPACLRVTLGPDASALVETAHHEIGNGLATLLAMAVADGLGLALDAVTVRLGDTDLPPASLSGGSSSTTSLANAVAEACALLRERLSAPAARGTGPLAGADPSALVFADGSITMPSGRAEPLTAALARLGGGPMVAEVEHVPEGLAPDAIDTLRAGKFQLGQVTGHRLAAAFGAQFAEVRVHAATGEVRVRRLIGAFAAGRILNPSAARSQFLGGMVWGIGSALLEATRVDGRSGRYTNADLADYLVPTSADVEHIEALSIDDRDPEVNPAGVKGLGEIGIIGVNAAIANAVFAATGKRVRSLPIRLEAML